MTAKETPTLRPRTMLVRGGLERSPFMETSEALYLTSGYVYETAEEAEAAFKGDVDRYIYSRYGNPTVAMFEERLRLFEGAEFCRGMASGMAAVFASIACQVKSGDRVVASRALFGSCQFILTEILPGYGIDVEIVDGADLDQWKKALSQPTAAIFMETPSNPGLEIIDLPAVAEMAHKAGAQVIVDNVFASPILQKPLLLGADIVVYSATKHIDGQGRCMGGAILATEEFVKEKLSPFYRHTGPSLSPFNAWVLVKSMETLSLRVEKEGAGALELAGWLQTQNKVRNVWYPGLSSHPQYELASRQMTGGGTVVTFEIAGGRDEAFRTLNALQVADISNNLGDAKSLVTHPATTTHRRIGPEARERIGITDGVIRLSVGLEDIEDLRDDLAQALEAV